MSAKLIVAVIGTVGVLGVLAATNGGGAESSRGSNPAGDFQRQAGGSAHHPGHRVAAPNEDATSTAVRARGKRPALAYFSSKFFTVSAQTATEEFSMKCPGGGEAINGYFGPKEPGVVLSNSDPSKNARKWWFQLLNLNSTIDVKYYTGIVCVKGLR